MWNFFESNCITVDMCWKVVLFIDKNITSESNWKKSLYAQSFSIIEKSCRTKAEKSVALYTFIRMMAKAFLFTHIHRVSTDINGSSLRGRQLVL